MEKPNTKKVAREAKKMTRYEIMIKATVGKLSWVQAADVLGITSRHMRRLRTEYQDYGLSALDDKRGGRPRKRRITEETVALICRLKKDVYEDFSVLHFYTHTHKGGRSRPRKAEAIPARALRNCRSPLLRGNEP